jgi:hypothetical protein
VRGEGVGTGVQGEHVDDSRRMIVFGFWFGLLGAIAGVLGTKIFTRLRANIKGAPSRS